jgi:FixJ family two-component response regulator
MLLAERPWVICVVDDNTSVRNGLTRLMRACGFLVRAFSSADSFLAGVDKRDQICVLIDISMPRVTGLQLQAQMKELDLRFPVIAFSARDDDEVRTTALALGARQFLRKPVDERELLEAIAGVTGQG